MILLVVITPVIFYFSENFKISFVLYHVITSHTPSHVLVCRFALSYDYLEKDCVMADQPEPEVKRRRTWRKFYCTTQKYTRPTVHMILSYCNYSSVHMHMYSTCTMIMFYFTHSYACCDYAWHSIIQ